MTLNNKILPVALVAALLGGSVGAFVMRPSQRAETAEAAKTAPVTKSNLDTTSNAADQSLAANAKDEIAANDANLTEGEMEAYREGFNDGVKAAREAGTSTPTATRYAAAPAATRVVYRPATRTRYVRSGNNSRRVYYDYGEQRPRSRSFWQKHRDKLTVAMGAGGGAIVGGLIGGKKGAAIGALAGGGGSALYTYKLRKRDRRY